MCISVDDLPTVSYGLGNEDFNLKITEGLLDAFANHDVKAIGFVNENKLYRERVIDSSQLNLLDSWLREGMDLGNHTFDHLNYHNVSFDLFTENIIKGELHTRTLISQYNDSLKYFRHPYLRVGRSASHADSLRNFLKENGYVVSPVTVDNEDYLFALAYSRAYRKKDTALMLSIGEDYVGYMIAKVKFYELQSQKLFHRQIAQTLLIHASLLNADYIDDLLQQLKNNDYRFISQSEALEDDAYSTPMTVYGEWGISWIDRWALSQGKSGDFFEGDIPTPDYIVELSR